MLRHFVPSRELHSLATLASLSLVDLPSANSIKCCSPPASLKMKNLNLTKGVSLPEEVASISFNIGLCVGSGQLQ